MSKSDFDLELHFLPAWAQESQDSKDRYAKYTGESEREGRRGNRDRGPRPRSRGGDRPRGNRPPDPQGRPRRDRGRSDRHGRPEQKREPQPLLELNVAFRPDDKGVESLARQIRMTGRAYPLFDIAQMILRKPERHSVIISVKKKTDGQPAQPLFTSALDDSLHLSEDDAIRYVFDKHFETFYQPEKTQIDAPKGTYTFVAQCGMSGVILGPPNHHDYQNQLRKLHAARFSRMPFETFKSRVKIVRDEETVKKWLEDQSWKTEYICLNMPEPLKLGSREEVEKHFRQTHLTNIIKSVESHTLTGTACRELKNAQLLRLIRQAWEGQKRFPLQIATVLSQQFAAHGLQFFKVNKTVTHVAVARPHYLDLEAEPVSEGVKRIVQYIEAHPKCTRRQLVSALLPPGTKPAPAQKVTPTPQNPPAPTSADSVPPATETPAAPAADAGSATAAPAESAPTASAPAQQPTAETPVHEPSAEETAIVADLHWVIHQGHVIEFANGVLETAKKPVPRPEKKKKAAEPTPETEPSTAPGKAKTDSETPAADVGTAGTTAAIAANATPPQLEGASKPTAETPPIAEPQPATDAKPNAETKSVITAPTSAELPSGNASESTGAPAASVAPAEPEAAPPPSSASTAETPSPTPADSIASSTEPQTEPASAPSAVTSPEVPPAPEAAPPTPPSAPPTAEPEAGTTIPTPEKRD